MRVVYTGKAAHLSERERDYAEKRLLRLARHFNSAREAHVTHRVERGRHQVEVQLDLDGSLLRAEERTTDFHACVDAVVEKLEVQLRRLKDRLRDRKGRPDAPTVALLLADAPEEEAHTDEMPAIVVKRKQFAIKPMSADEAALQMELLHHDFHVFLDAESGMVNVLYRRRDDNYGLLEVEA